MCQRKVFVDTTQEVCLDIPGLFVGRRGHFIAFLYISMASAPNIYVFIDNLLLSCLFICQVDYVRKKLCDRSVASENTCVIMGDSFVNN